MKIKKQWHKETEEKLKRAMSICFLPSEPDPLGVSGIRSAGSCLSRYYDRFRKFFLEIVGCNCRNGKSDNQVGDKRSTSG